jgi:hypothetical protein
MQAAIDRVIRTFTLKHPPTLVRHMPDDRSDAARDEATAFASQLLGNYREQLARRSAARD